jgi:hypothetical protein
VTKQQAVQVWQQAMASKGFEALAAFHGAGSIGDGRTDSLREPVVKFLREVAEALAQPYSHGVRSQP